MERRRVVLWLPPLAYMAAIYAVSSMSAPAPQVTRLVWDKAIHFFEYGVLAVLLFRALQGEGFRSHAAAILAAVLASMYGATDEWHQSFVPLRESGIGDWASDTLGAAAGSIVAQRRQRTLSTASRPPRRPPR